MMLSLWPNWWDDWSYQWACTFVGETRQIIVNPVFDTITVKRDIYSAWKEWAQLRDNAKFPQAIRAIGGDPIGGGLFAGDLYFLMNGWQVIVDHTITVTGALFHDDGINPYNVQEGGGVTSVVSNLVQTTTTEGSGSTDLTQVYTQLNNIESLIRTNKNLILTQ